MGRMLSENYFLAYMLVSCMAEAVMLMQHHVAA